MAVIVASQSPCNSAAPPLLGLRAHREGKIGSCHHMGSQCYFHHWLFHTYFSLSPSTSLFQMSVLSMPQLWMSLSASPLRMVLCRSRRPHVEVCVLSPSSEYAQPIVCSLLVLNPHEGYRRTLLGFRVGPIGKRFANSTVN